MKALIVGIAVVMILSACTVKEPVEKDLKKYEIATFAGGCFWCMEAAFEIEDGVVEVISGFTGGTVENPTYEQVSSGTTGHTEAVQVYYDPGIISYAALVEIFWRQIDPTDGGGQFADRGSEYIAAIYYAGEDERLIAEASKNALELSGKFTDPIVTPVLPVQPFFQAEEYHQDYYKKRSAQYKLYERGSGRAEFKEQVWKEKSLKDTLTPLQYKVTQEDGTEPPYDNEYWDNKEPGIYVDVVSGEPLFSSLDKFDSGTGWPSFSKPLEEENIVLKDDRKLLFKRTEVRSKKGNSHLGHLFNDGPGPTGLRYCINSAALRFIHKDDLEKEGYGKYVSLFKEK